MKGEGFLVFPQLLILIETLALLVFCVLRDPVDFGFAGFFYIIWITTTVFLNIAALLVLLVYRPKLWYVISALLILLPLMPFIIMMSDFISFLDLLMNSAPALQPVSVAK